MLFRPAQSPIPTNQQQPIHNPPPRINFNNRTSNLRVQSPPPPRFIHQSPPPASRVTSDYMMHLIPQPNPSQSPQNSKQFSSFMQPHNSSVLTQVANRKFQLSNQTSMTNQKPVFMMNSPNLSTTDARSRGVSDLSNKRSMVVMAHQNAYLSPPPPLDLRKLQPVRRTSQYKVNVQQTSEVGSNRSQSQQNIKIIIETSIPKASEIKPPTVTVSQVNSAPSQLHHQQIFNGPAFSRVVVGSPRSVHFQQNQRVTTSQDTQFRSVELMNHQIQNQGRGPVMFTPIYRTINERPHSYSMDTKHIVGNGQQHSHRLQVTNNVVMTPLTVHPPSQVFVDRKPVSFSAQPFSQVAQVKLSQQQKFGEQTKKSFESDKLKSQNKLSIQSHKKRKQQGRKLQRQIYNQYYDDEEEFDSSMTQGQHYRRRENIYTMQEDKIMFNTKLLINEMYQNQMNRALLRMRSIDSMMIREKSVRRRYL